MERELKILCDPDALSRLAKSRFLAQSGAKATKKTLISIYFDTPDRLLARHGSALRLRKVGRRWVQTLKHQPDGLRSGFSTPREVELHVAHPQPQLDRADPQGLLAATRDLIGGQALAPVFETRIERRLWSLVLPAGTVEVALDRGAVAAGVREAALYEVEIELVSGGIEAVFAAAKGLFGSGPLRFSPLSKAERGYLLAKTGRDLPPLAPRYAQRPAYTAEMSAETAMRDSLRDCLGQILQNAVCVAESTAPEGPHQLRVGLRRLRAAITLFDDLLGPDAKPIADAARRLAQETGKLRDLDVLIDSIAVPLLPALGEPAAEAALGATLAARRQAARATLRTVLASRRTVAFTLDLVAFVETRGWLDREDWSQAARLARPIRKLAPALLERRYAKVRKRGRRISQAGVEERHALRKQLKTLRYTAEFLHPVWGKRAARFIKCLKACQEGFGQLNDASMAQTLLRQGGADTPAEDAAVQRASGFLLGVLSERSRAEMAAFDALWARFCKEKPFWR